MPQAARISSPREALRVVSTPAALSLSLNCSMTGNGEGASGESGMRWKRIRLTLHSIHPGEHDVFEAHPPLSRKIILPYKGQCLTEREWLLHRHQLSPLLREGVMQAHCQMAGTLVHKTAQGRSSRTGIRRHAYGRKGYALGAPSESPGGRQNVDDATDAVPVVQGAHEHGIGQFRSLVHLQELGKDLRGSQVAVPSAATSHAEAAAHTAALLGGDTERAAVLVGNHHGLHSGTERK